MKGRSHYFFGRYSSYTILVIIVLIVLCTIISNRSSLQWKKLDNEGQQQIETKKVHVSFNPASRSDSSSGFREVVHEELSKRDSTLLPPTLLDDHASSVSSNEEEEEDEETIIIPPWPQTDQRIQNAVLAGERIIGGDPTTTESSAWNKGDEDENNLATIVSMFYDLSSSSNRTTASSSSPAGVSGKNRVDQYQTWLRNFLACTDPLIFFCEPNSWVHDLVREHRQHHAAPTIIVGLPFDQLTTHTNFDESFWYHEGTAKDPYDTSYTRANQTSVYQLWNEKIILVHEVSRLNPFQTQHFVWLDAGYFRGGSSSSGDTDAAASAVVRGGGRIVRNSLTQNGGLQPQQILLHHIYRPHKKRKLLAGGCWGGSATGIQNFYQVYWKAFWFMVQHDIPCVGYEQHVFVQACQSFPDACLIHSSQEQHEDDWFDMGRLWLRNASLDFSVNRVWLNMSSADDTGATAIGGRGRNDHGSPQNKKQLVRGEVKFPRVFPIHAPLASDNQ